VNEEMGFKHFLLSEAAVVEDEKALLKKLSLESKDRLPKIPAGDPALTELEREPGSIIELKSINPASGAKETSYRLVEGE